MTNTQEHTLYLDIAKRCAQESHATRAKVGCVIAKNDTIISYGWNGQPKGLDNCCEVYHPELGLKTLPTVLHAEVNAIAKVANSTLSTKKATAYLTLSPCVDCAKLLIQSGISTVVFTTRYRDTSGLALLLNSSIIVLEEINDEFIQLTQERI